eukprot:5598551-Pleurochrysis_carterae.AAC.1
MGRRRTEMGEQAGSGEYGGSGGRSYIQSKGASEGGAGHVHGIYGRPRNGHRTTDMGSYMERVSEVRAARGQREIS